MISENTMHIIQRFHATDQFVFEIGPQVKVQDKIYPTFVVVNMANEEEEVSESFDNSETDSENEVDNSSDE